MKFLKLSSGQHKEGSGEGCIMEAVSAVMGERWSDQPECVDPVLIGFSRIFNDFLPDDLRSQYLAPRLLDFIGTRGTLEDSIRRAKIAVEYSRIFAKYAAESAKYAAKSAATAAQSAKSAAKYAEYAAALFAGHAAALSAAKYAAKSAEYAAESAKYAAERKRIYDLCAECLDKMIHAGPHAQKQPEYSVNEISEMFGGFVEVEK